MDWGFSQQEIFLIFFAFNLLNPYSKACIPVTAIPLTVNSLLFFKLDDYFPSLHPPTLNFWSCLYFER